METPQIAWIALLLTARAASFTASLIVGWAWMVRASSSFPVPLSPTISTRVSVGATFSTSRRTSPSAADAPTIGTSAADAMCSRRARFTCSAEARRSRSATDEAVAEIRKNAKNPDVRDAMGQGTDERLTAVLDAYRPLLPRDRFPRVILTLGLPFEDVDVNDLDEPYGNPDYESGFRELWGVG